ncbi:hypothetical protein [Sphingomonas sp. NFX23]|uniref:hypothetical protein n=1 Tax=Sphingomonas sp. NFX23 TaxID=2819532 RepID=UPI003CFA1A9C
MNQDVPKINVPLGEDRKLPTCVACRHVSMMNAPPCFPELGTEPHMFCVRMPPVLVGSSDARGFSRWSAYTPVEEDSRCGEWLQKSDA